MVPLDLKWCANCQHMLVTQFQDESPTRMPCAHETYPLKGTPHFMACAMHNGRTIILRLRRCPHIMRTDSGPDTVGNLEANHIGMHTNQLKYQVTQPPVYLMLHTLQTFFYRRCIMMQMVTLGERREVVAEQNI